MGPRPFGKLCEAACHSGTMRESAPGAREPLPIKTQFAMRSAGANSGLVRKNFVVSMGGPQDRRTGHQGELDSLRKAGKGQQEFFNVSACFHLTEFGLPSAEEMESMDKFEDALASSLEGSQTAHLMVILTGDSERDWLWYTRGEEEAMREVNQALKGHNRYPVSFRFRKIERGKPTHSLREAVILQQVSAARSVSFHGRLQKP